MKIMVEATCTRCSKDFTFEKEQFTKQANATLCDECCESVYGVFSKALGEQTYSGR